MPETQVTELTNALETFNNVSLPALSFFFVVLFLIIMGLLIRGIFGRDKRRDDLLSMAMQSSTSNGTAITGLKQDIADTLKVMRDDSTKAGLRHDETIAALTATVATHNSNIIVLQESNEAIAIAINKVNDAIAEIKAVLPTLARQSEMDMLVGRMDEAIKRLEETKRDCLEKKRDTKPIPIIPLPPENGTQDILDKTGTDG